MTDENIAEVDLARLADGYRFRPASEASIERARHAGASLSAGSTILDVGGGPGHHAAVWAEQGHHPIVLDPTQKMTLPAADRGLPVVLGVSQALPFRSDVFDLVWFHLSLHYGDWRLALDEAVRVCKAGGGVEIWTLSEDHHAASLLARWFPSVQRIDLARFPDGGHVERYLDDRATAVSRSRVVEQKTRPAGDWLAAVEAGFVSTLQLIDADELEAGLAGFQRAYPNPVTEIDYELRLDRITATTEEA
jgi:ubiquinone/menaquinone biosynthesis C-methylase UbiE